MVLFLLNVGEEFLFIGEVCVYQRLKPLPDFVVHVFGRRTDSFPYLLKFVQLLSGVLPLFVGDGFCLKDFFGLVDQGVFGHQVALLFFPDLVVILPAPLVDLVSGVLEAFPDLVFLVLRHRTDLLPLIMVLLKLLE